MENLHLARAIWKKFKLMVETQGVISAAKRGRPRASERKAFMGICYVVWSGCPWRALPSKYGKRSTVHRYFKKWADSGLFQKLWHTVLVFLNQKGQLKNNVHVVDGSLVGVQHLSKQVAFISTKLRPKRAIKFSLLVDAQGIPLVRLFSALRMSMIQIYLNQQLIKK